ncbi:unnamed protein product [Sphagnum jensenii]|jgi:hypothetical protein|uniref:Uncharacterized protein n=1 Tax=Sphagnum jensenii TaxID=128206 RepID=A0ABP0VZI6_9BRYO
MEMSASVKLTSFAVESIIIMLFAAFCCCIIYAGQLVGGTPVPQGDWSKLKLQQASSKNKKKKKGAPTKDAFSKREGLHDCLEIWPMRKHAILNNNINILSKELWMEQKK